MAPLLKMSLVLLLLAAATGASHRNISLAMHNPAKHVTSSPRVGNHTARASTVRKAPSNMAMPKSFSKKPSMTGTTVASAHAKPKHDPSSGLKHIANLTARAMKHDLSGGLKKGKSLFLPEPSSAASATTPSPQAPSPASTQAPSLELAGCVLLVVSVLGGAFYMFTSSGVHAKSSDTAAPDAKGKMSPIAVAALSIIYCASGSLLSWANKVISVGEKRLDLSVILILQNSVTFMLIFILAKLAPATVRALRVEGWSVILKQFVPLTALFCAMLVTSLKAFQGASIAAVVVQRNLISLVVAAAEWAFLGRGTNMLAVLSLFGILAGAVIFGVGDVEFDTAGYIWLSLNILASSTFQILNKKLVHGVDLSSFGFSFFNNLISVAMLAVWALPSGALAESVTLIPHTNAVALGLSCFLGFALSVSAFALSKEVSATTMMVVNNSNKFLLVIIIEVLQLGKPIGVQGWVGCTLAIAFAMLYTHARMRG